MPTSSRASEGDRTCPQSALAHFLAHSADLPTPFLALDSQMVSRGVLDAPPAVRQRSARPRPTVETIVRRNVQIAPVTTARVSPWWSPMPLSIVH